MSTTIPDKNGQDAGIDPYNGKVLLAAVICLSVVIFFVLLLHGYARWVLRRRRRRRPIVAHVVTEPFHRRSLSAYPGHSSTEAGLAPGTGLGLGLGLGLDAKVVASLPMFVYTAKEEDDQNGLHCVVCLSVMEEGEIGRLLPTCKHGFHVECIDMWLMSHSTCPICRAPVIKNMDEMGLAAGDGVVVLVEVEVEDEPRRSNEELGVLSGTVVEEGEVIVEMPICSTIAKGDESSNSTSSSSSSSSASSSSSSSSVACSLKRMLSRSRSESKVFPSLPVS